MHLINLIVNYLYRKYGVPLHIFFSKFGPEVQATFNVSCAANLKKNSLLYISANQKADLERCFKGMEVIRVYQS